VDVDLFGSKFKVSHPLTRELSVKTTMPYDSVLSFTAAALAIIMASRQMDARASLSGPYDDESRNAKIIAAAIHG
jgi:hypothetical protein